MTTPPRAPTHPLDAPSPIPPTTSAGSGRRLDGVDAARALAIIGMVTVHVAAPFGGDYRTGDVGWFAAPYGRASATFAFVAGLGITLAARRRPWAASATQLLWRATWLAPLGLLLGALGTPVAVILQYYAMWFVLAIPFVRAPTWLLASVTAVGVVVGPTVLVVAQVRHPEWYAPPGAGAWAGTVGDVMLTGYYPTVSWIWIVYAGMLVARLDLADRGVVRRVTLTGTAVAVVAYQVAAVVRSTVDLGAYPAWADTVGHSDTPLETIAVIGVATAVVGVCLLVADLAHPLIVPLALLGRLALTVYVGHIVAYALLRDQFLSFSVAEAVVTTAQITIVGTLFAAGWLAVFRRGPLEAMDRAGYEHLARPLVELVAPGSTSRSSSSDPATTAAAARRTPEG